MVWLKYAASIQDQRGSRIHGVNPEPLGGGGLQTSPSFIEKKKILSQQKCELYNLSEISFVIKHFAPNFKTRDLKKIPISPPAPPPTEVDSKPVQSDVFFTFTLRRNVSPV